MLRIRAYRLDEGPRSTGEQFVSDVLAILRDYSPEKFDYQGEGLTRHMIELTFRTANRYGITQNRGILVIAALMFMLGSGVDHDLLHPWVNRALIDPSFPDEHSRTDALYREAMTHISTSLESD